MIIEWAQSLIGRVSDIDDVILNGTGAVVGACVALLLRAARSRHAAARRPQRAGGTMAVGPGEV